LQKNDNLSTASKASVAERLRNQTRSSRTIDQQLHLQEACQPQTRIRSRNQAVACTSEAHGDRAAHQI
jgi:hypothetical protein